MRLSSKYVSGFGVILLLLVGFFIEGTSLLINPLYFLLLQMTDSLPNPFPSFIFGFTIITVGIIFYWLLFAPERIMGHQLEFEASPDLSTFRIIKRTSGEPTNKEIEIPETAYCSTCGKNVFKPYRCQKCGQLLCGSHYLPGDHQCKEES